jgi:hypothetical protein
MIFSRAMLGALIAVAAFGCSTANSQADPTSHHLAAMKAVAPGTLLQVGWGGWRGGWGHRGWGFRPWGWGAAAAGAVIGGALVAGPYYPPPYPYYGAYYAPAPYYGGYAYGAPYAAAAYAGCYPYGPYACVDY